MVKIISGTDLVKWKGPEKNEPFPGLPSLSRRSNPILVSSLIAVSSYKSGSIQALNKNTGALEWKVNLETYGGHSLDAKSNAIYASTNYSVIKVLVKTGDRIWSYEPYGKNDESFYTDAIHSAGKIFITDRYGYLHAINEKNGQMEWKILVEDKGTAVNATVTVLKNKVFTISTKGNLCCVDKNKGKILWSVRLAEGSICPPIICKRKIYIRGKDSLFIVNLTDKKIAKVRFLNIVDMAIKNDKVYIITNEIFDNDEQSIKKLWVYYKNKKKFLTTLSNSPSGFAFIKKADFLAIAGYSGLSFFNIKKNCIQLEVSEAFTSTPLITNSYIYMVGFKNEILCLKNPLFRLPKK